MNTAAPKRRMAVEPFVTCNELVARWRVSQPTVSRLITSKKLASLKIGGQYRIKLSEVERYEKFGARRAA